MQHPKIIAGLYLVSTPIGTAGDITLRALDILTNVDVIAAEDTRQARKIMDIHGIHLGDRRLLPYHDHNGAMQRPRLLSLIQAGKSVAYVSDAGTPLIADPGYKLAQALIGAGLPVTSAPGPSALLAALSVAGLPTDRFLFSGFLPPKQSARRRTLNEMSAIKATLVFYESPKRLPGCLTDMAKILGNRQAAVCRELTKKFEEIRRDPLDVLALHYANQTAKGEIVIVVGPPGNAQDSPENLDDLIESSLESQSVNDTARYLSSKYDLPRKMIYDRAVVLKSDKE